MPPTDPTPQAIPTPTAGLPLTAAPNKGDWKTTLSGTMAGAASAIVMMPGHFDLPTWAVNLAIFVVVGGLAGLGINARDKTVLMTPPPTPAKGDAPNDASAS